MIGSIIKKNVAEMYWLSWDQENLRLIFAINEKIIAFIKREMEHSIYPIETLREKFPKREKYREASIFDFEGNVDLTKKVKKERFDIFAGDFSKDFGFGKVFKYLGKDKKRFTKFSIEFNDIGKQEDNYSLAISATFDFLTYVIGNYELRIVENNYRRKIGEEKEIEIKKDFQIMTFSNTVDTSGLLGRNGIGGHISIPMRNWLKNNYKTIEKSKIVKAMASINESKNTNGFSATIWETGGFIIDCPGNACGLNPEGSLRYSTKEGEGFEFGCHNVDRISQQLYLLIGLATLCDLYRESIK